MTEGWNDGRVGAPWITEALFFGTFFGTLFGHLLKPDLLQE